MLVGSLRAGSWSRTLARALLTLAPAPLAPEIVEIGDLPLYNADLEESVPDAWRRFRDRIRRAEAVLFVTPEYNRTIPGALKNAIDVGSRPRGQNVWGGKPGAVISCSPGSLAGFGANHHLRQAMVFLDVPMLMQPEAYIGGVDKLFDADGRLANEGTRAFLEKFMAAYAVWVARIRKG